MDLYSQVLEISGYDHVHHDDLRRILKEILMNNISKGKTTDEDLTEIIKNTIGIYEEENTIS